MTSIAVVGAAGQTGRIIVRQALTRGYDVTAIARRPGHGEPDRNPRLTSVTADVRRPGALAEVLDGHDAVISALGATGRGATTVYSDGTAAIVAALPPNARLLVISSAGIELPADAGPVARLAGRLLHRIMRDTYSDMLRMEQLLADSALNWTSVRPTRLTDEPASGTPRIALGATRRVGTRTSRADLANYLLDAVPDARTHRIPVAISS